MKNVLHHKVFKMNQENKYVALLLGAAVGKQLDCFCTVLKVASNRC